jgi:hypothetical protein
MRSRSQMAFQKMPCTRCGSERILGAPCDDCGMEAPRNEVNARVVRRRTAVGLVDQELARRRVELSGAEAVQSEQLLAAVKSFASCVMAFIDDDGATESRSQMTDAVALVEKLRFRHDAVTHLRPDLARTRAISKTLRRLSELWPAYKLVLASSTIREAQRLGEDAQSLLDSVGGALDALAERMDAVAFYVNDPSIPLFERALTMLQGGRERLSLTAIGKAGAEQVRTELGLTASEPLGAQYLATTIVAEVYLDIERFQTVAREATIFCSDSSKLSVLAATPGAIDALIEGKRALIEAFTAFEVIIHHEQSEDALIRRLIKFHAEVYEGAGLSLFVWYLHLGELKTRAFDKMLEDNATDHAITLAQSPFASWFVGSDPYLRHAGQHGSSTFIANGQVTFKLRSFKETVTVAELVDGVYTFLESLFATTWALENALDQTGVDLQIYDNDAAYLGVSKLHVATVVLETLGESVHRAEQVGNSWEIDLGDGNDLFATAISLAKMAGNKISKVSIQRIGSKDRLLSVSLNAVTTALNATEQRRDPRDSLINLLRFRSEFLLDGSPVVTRADFLYTVGTLGLFMLVNDDQTMIPYLRSVKKLAITMNEPEVTDLIDDVFRRSRIHDGASRRELATRLNGHVATHVLLNPESTRIAITM